ncbi:MAG: cytochrome c-type biogenesis protein [Halofilum sp. (in: g-proteobacteria)]
MTGAWRTLLLLALAVATAGPLIASDSVREFDNAAEENRYRDLLEEVRCLVCQNQSLESSDAELARDLRNEVYRLVVEEDRSREEAIEFLTERYGDFVLYRPPMQASTWLLWFGPVVLLVVGAAIAAIIIRQRPRREPLTAEEHERARRLLDSDEEGPEAR